MSVLNSQHGLDGEDDDDDDQRADVQAPHRPDELADRRQHRLGHFVDEPHDRVIAVNLREPTEQHPRQQNQLKDIEQKPNQRKESIHPSDPLNCEYDRLMSVR